MTANDIIDGWNTLCAGHAKLPRKKRLTDKLLRQIKSRLKEQPDKEFWQTVMNACIDNAFLAGRRTEWHVTLDWLVENAENAVKVFEGAYDHVRATEAEPE